MAKAVFTTKIDPTYDDLPEDRYHFPKTYLNQVKAAHRDWIVYYEPRRSTGDRSSSGGRSAYFATARVTEIIADPVLPDHYYAKLADYLEFDHPVPFKNNDFYYENMLRKADGSTNKGAFGRAVRNLSDQEYDLILQTGFAFVLGDRERLRRYPDPPEEPLQYGSGLAEEAAFYESEMVKRPIIEQVCSRPFRDRAFSTAVKAAYHDTCAITGIKIINGGGRSEVQAAHIRPVAEDGPDSIRNGIALSGTIHWMFDRGLISIDGDYSLLIAENRLPYAVSRILNPSSQLLLPNRIEERPHPQFLKYHRDHIYKG